MAQDKNRFWRSVVIVFALVSVLWIVQLLQYYNIYDFSEYGNWPHHIEGLKGIIFSPFIHSKEHFDHLISNTLPILVLLIVLLNAYPRVAFLVLIFIHITSGVLVWLLAPSTTVHIGISGIIYGIATFLVASGLFRKDRTSVAIAIFVGIAYGGMVIGFLPKEGVSWQSHLYGSISGLIIAFIFRKKDLPRPAETELEEKPRETHFFEEHPHLPPSDIQPPV